MDRRQFLIAAPAALIATKLPAVAQSEYTTFKLPEDAVDIYLYGMTVSYYWSDGNHQEYHFSISTKEGMRNKLSEISSYLSWKEVSPGFVVRPAIDKAIVCIISPHTEYLAISKKLEFRKETGKFDLVEVATVTVTKI